MLPGRSRAHQRALILMMAEHDGFPAVSPLHQVAELEYVIASVEALRL